MTKQDPIEARRASIRNLLDRAGRGVLTISEAELLRQQVEAEQRTADHTEGALARMRDRAEVATVRESKAKAAIARVHALRTDWLSTGAPPLGTSIARWWDKRLIELAAALDEPKEPTS